MTPRNRVCVHGVTSFLRHPHPGVPTPGSLLTLLGAESSIDLPQRRTVNRELLRVDQDRRFELRPEGNHGVVLMDFGPGVVNATIVGKLRATLEIEFLMHGVGPVPLDLWCSSLRPGCAQVTLSDAFGRVVVPDVTSRDPSMGAMMVPTGRYLLGAEVTGGTAVLRLAQGISAAGLREAV